MSEFHWRRPPFATRVFDQSDLAALQRLIDRCADFYQIVEGRDPAPDAADGLARDVPPGRSSEEKFLYVVEDGAGELAGVLEGIRDYPKADEWWIGLLLLAPDLRGRGIGRDLVEDFCLHAAAQGCRAMGLGVVEENTPALAFWKRVGFVEARRTEPRLFGEKRQAVLVMRRSPASPVGTRAPKILPSWDN